MFFKNKEPDPYREKSWGVDPDSSNPDLVQVITRIWIRILNRKNFDVNGNNHNF